MRTALAASRLLHNHHWHLHMHTHTRTCMHMHTHTATGRGACIEGCVVLVAHAGECRRVAAGCRAARALALLWWETYYATCLAVVGDVLRHGAHEELGHRALVMRAHEHAGRPDLLGLHATRTQGSRGARLLAGLLVGTREEGGPSKPWRVKRAALAGRCA